MRTFAPLVLPAFLRNVPAVCAILFMGAARGYAEPLRVEAGRAYALGTHFQIGRDVSGILTLEEILQKPDPVFFEPSSHPIPSFGYTPDALWLRLALENSAETPLPFLFSLQIARVREVDWYWVVEGESIQTRSEGIDRPPLQANRSRFPMFAVTLPAGKTSFLYLRIASDQTLYVPLNGAAGENSFVLDTRWNFADHLFLGSGMAMVVFALMVSLAHPGAGFVYLAVVTFFYQSYYMIFHGYLDWFFPGLPAWYHRQLLLVAISLGSTFLVMFTRQYFQNRPGSEKRTRVLNGIVVLCFASVLFLAAAPFSVGIHGVMFMNAAVYFGGLFLAALDFYRRRTVSEACFFFAWLWISLSTLSFIFQLYIPIIGHLHPMMITRLMVPMMYFLFLSANLQRQYSLREARENELQAKQAEVRANLETLRYQLNPHFLFNALNAIDALSRTAPGKISEVVLKLATFLRLRLKPSRDGMLPLREEILVCRAYLDIEKIRFEERLQVVWQIDAACEYFSVPEMILQPLIENAVKYGLKQNETLNLCVSARQDKSGVVLSVRNNGKLVDFPNNENTASNLGISNLKKRLQYQYGNQGRFMLEQNAGWVTATVMIPQAEKTNEKHSSDYC